MCTHVFMGHQLATHIQANMCCMYIHTSDCTCIYILYILCMDEIHFAPPKTPWGDASPVNTGLQTFWFALVSARGALEADLDNHPQYQGAGAKPLCQASGLWDLEQAMSAA